MRRGIPLRTRSSIYRRRTRAGALTRRLREPTAAINVAPASRPIATRPASMFHISGISPVTECILVAPSTFLIHTGICIAAGCDALTWIRSENRYRPREAPIQRRPTAICAATASNPLSNRASRTPTRRTDKPVRKPPIERSPEAYRH
jgi:hypothetical protein